MFEPKTPKQAADADEIRYCVKCGRPLAAKHFIRTRSPFFQDGRVNICLECLTGYLKKRDFAWEAIDKLCQWADLPFIVKEWERLRETSSEDMILDVYASTFKDDCYEELGWDSYHKQYKKLKEVGLIEDEVPLVREQKYEKLRQKWGKNYDDEDLLYLEDLYKGICNSQNVVSALQIDQAQKLCKLSLEIDQRIIAGDKDVDKFLSSYDRIMKAGEFTPKNAKNAQDFDSFAELAVWLEKRGKQNRYYDNVTRDVVDQTLKALESYNQKLYINEGGIGDEITNRIESLHLAQSALDLDATGNIYDLPEEMNLDDFDNELYNPEEFIAELDNGGIVI